VVIFLFAGEGSSACAGVFPSLPYFCLLYLHGTVVRGER
jgi:hypothetical protein